jgi:flagellar motor component MotA
MRAARAATAARLTVGAVAPVTAVAAGTVTKDLRVATTVHLNEVAVVVEATAPTAATTTTTKKADRVTVAPTALDRKSVV